MTDKKDWVTPTISGVVAVFLAIVGYLNKEGERRIGADNASLADLLRLLPPSGLIATLADLPLESPPMFRGDELQPIVDVIRAANRTPSRFHDRHVGKAYRSLVAALRSFMDEVDRMERRPLGLYVVRESDWCAESRLNRTAKAAGCAYGSLIETARRRRLTAQL
jgi:hypothetical protein